MGRHRHRHRRGGNDNDSKAREKRGDQAPGKRGQYKLVIKENKFFENYYKAQCIVPEDEWDDFLTSLKSPLPATFRITGNRSQAKEVLKHIEGDYVSKLLDATIKEEDGKEVKFDPPVPLPWYPNRLAWQLNMSRKYIRFNDTFKKLHNFLISETESGNMSRQEAVSMIPPLALDVQPHHKVLDMCAAPGSKTSQLIEYLHKDSSIPDGFVVANDSDNKRCYLMVHQVKRLESPNFVIVNEDASLLPSFRLNPQSESRREVMCFDRILADVPCSGDGTMRKNPDVWAKWNAGSGNNLHHLQLRILRRGLEMLEVGGRLVYSTCSFNPIEDEAVICSMLQQCKGSIKLVNLTDNLPGLKYTKGKTTWKVYSRFGETFEKFSDVPEKLSTQIRPSMFPPSEDKVKDLNLDLCVRILPHHQNTGGFFIAAIEKTDTLPWFTRKNKQGDAQMETEKNGDKKQQDTVTEEKEEEAKETEETTENNDEEEEKLSGRKRKILSRAGSPPLPKKKKVPTATLR